MEYQMRRFFVMIYFRIIIIFLTFQIICLHSGAQSMNDSFDKLNQLAKQNSLPEERIALIIDRELYICGEKIFFKSFSYDANWFLPLSLSTILYLELYNQENAIISSAKYTIQNGECSGTIQIPRTIASDIYYLRAYTNYMKNFGVQSFYLKKLKIINPFSELLISSPAESEPDIINCKIYPESGKLITGIESRLSCRITNSKNRGLQINARVLDSDNNILTTFKTCKNGFASFYLTPEKDKKYHIEVDDKNKLAESLIPESLPAGTSFSTRIMDNNTLQVIILSNSLNDFPVTLYAKRGEFIYPLTDSPLNSPGEYYIAPENIPKGLLSLELYNSAGYFLAGKLLFQKGGEYLNIKLNTDKENYSAREKIKVSIEISDNNGRPVEAELSVFSAINSGISSYTNLNFVEIENLREELMQACQDNDLIQNALSDKNLLELLLLNTSHEDIQTSGSAKLNIKFLPEIKGDIITGKLTFKNNEPAAGKEILQSFIGKTTWIESTFTNKEGRFFFINKRFENTGDLILKVIDPEEEVILNLENEFFTEFPIHLKENLQLTNEETELISKKFINIQIDDAYRKDEVNEMPQVYNDTIPFYGNEYNEYVFKDYYNLPNMREFIHDIVLGVTLSKTNKKDVINILEENTLKRIGPKPLVLIDGIPVDDAKYVIELPPEKINLVRVVRNKFFYKNQTFDGILDIITNLNDATAFPLPENTFRFRFENINNSKTLIPIEMPIREEERIPFYKNLIYWNSEIVSQKDGKYFLTLTAPDNSGIFNIKCFGRNNEGITGEAEKFITIGKSDKSL